MSDAPYIVKVACDNCGTGGQVKIRRATRIGKARCPNCGCTTLARHWWLWPWTRRFRSSNNYASSVSP